MLLESILDYDASTLDKSVEPIVTRELGIKFQS
jgi:hypothetical protein